jgi:hypothetical protein
MINGCQLLMNLKATSGATSDYFTYHSVKIQNSSLDRGIEFYQIGIDKFVGNCLIKRLKGRQFTTVEQLQAALVPETNLGPGKWVDLAGLFAPERAVQQMLDDIENDHLQSLEQLTEAFRTMHEKYPVYEWSWAANILQRRLGKTLEKVTPDDIIKLANQWKSAVIKLDQRLHADAKKEFAPTAQIGYGLDGDDKTRQDDFEQVRGIFDKNSFVSEIEEHIANKSALGDELISRMEQLRQGQS